MDKICNIANFHRTDLVICSHSREVKTLFYSRINMTFVLVGHHGTRVHLLSTPFE